MSTPAYRWHDSETSPPGHRLPQRWETALFGLGLLLSLAILCYFAYRVVCWQELAERGSRTHTLYVVGATALASLALFSSCRWCLLLLLAFAARCHQRRRPPSAPATWTFVSIFVPSYNESATIASALRSLIELDYPAYEVIVVNGGSADDTLRQARVF